ncbi:MAG TPA: carboxypeptidase-like regulatory domain-containing protein [Pirellulaceae bacterium]|nr:carboxypeptidase-like regulatory domain-containing protein [Pirellulaceae bacterium]
MKLAKAFVLMIGLTAGTLGALALMGPAVAGTVDEATDTSTGADAGTPRHAGGRHAGGERVTVRGRVLNPDSQPFAGARVYAGRLSWGRDSERQLLVETESDQEGRFEFSIPKRRFLGGSIQVAAAAPGFGPAWVWRESELHHDLLLRLVSDEPIKGRLVDPEGRAVSGVRVTVNSMHVTKDGDIAPLISSLRERQQGIWLGSSKDVSSGPIGGALTPTLYAAVHTDAGGRFNLRGIGRERLVSLIIEAPTIETQLLHVLTSPGVSTIHVPENEQHPQFGMKSYYGSEFTHAVEPSRPIVGTVRDASTGQPVAGVRVASTRRIGSPSRFIETVTDERGQYRLTGMRKAKDQRIWIIPSLSHSYPAMAASVGLSRDFGPVTVNVDLPRGVRIEGTVLDKSTGKPVPARVMYMAFRTNPHFMRIAEEGLHLLHADFNFAETTADGTFSLIGLPGPGIVAVRATTAAYLGAVGAEQIDGFDRRYRSLNTSPTCWVENYHALAEVVAGENDEQIRRDLVLDPGRTVAGEVVGPTGEERAGAIAFGLTPSGFGFRWQLEPLPSSSFTVMAIKRGEKRTLLFLHDREQLAGMVEVDAADETVVAKLLPWGTLKGRLLDAHGQPRKGVELLASGPRAGGYNSVPNLPRERLLTDQEGRFRIAGLVAGLKYCFRLRELVDENERLVSVVDAVEMQPGQTVDLGDVRPTAH